MTHKNDIYMMENAIIESVLQNIRRKDAIILGFCVIFYIFAKLNSIWLIYLNPMHK